MRSDKMTEMVQNTQNMEMSSEAQECQSISRLRKRTYCQLACSQVATFIFFAIGWAGVMSALQNAGSEQRWLGIMIALPMLVAFVLGILVMGSIRARMKRDGLICTRSEAWNRFW